MAPLVYPTMTDRSSDGTKDSPRRRIVKTELREFILINVRNESYVCAKYRGWVARNDQHSLRAYERRPTRDDDESRVTTSNYSVEAQTNVIAKCYRA